MPLDYARFSAIVDADSDSEADEAGCSLNSRYDEEGLLRAFVSIHERRLEIDKMLGASPERESVAAGYDDVCSRLLVLDGVNRGADVRSVGHRVEFVIAALRAAKAYLAQGNLEAAESRASDAVEAVSTGSMPSNTQAEHLRHGAQWLQDQLREALMCRAEVRLLLGKYEAARSDALDAYPIARKFDDAEAAKAAEQLALRCEVGLHGGGPEADAKPLRPEDVESMLLASVGGGRAASTYEETEDTADPHGINRKIEVSHASSQADAGTDVTLPGVGVDLSSMD